MTSRNTTGDSTRTFQLQLFVLAALLALVIGRGKARRRSMEAAANSMGEDQALRTQTTTALSRVRKDCSMKHQLATPTRPALHAMAPRRLFVALCILIHAIPVAWTADPYDELYDAIMLRRTPGGRLIGHDEITPLIYGRSEFPFDPGSFKKFDAALRRFDALPQKTIEKYSDFQRAILQRHLWALFDATFVQPDSVERKPNPNRPKSRARIASLISRLALSKAKILALPQTGIATVKSGKYAKAHDPSDPFAPFLPADLYAKSSSWVGFGRTDYPADEHSTFKTWRSAFFQFVQAPGDREKTLATLEGINRGEVFPIGTQFALIERAFLISDEKELILSPLVLGIELRTYLDVKRTHFEAAPSPTQCLTEFVLQPKQVMRGNLVLRALDRDEIRWKSFNPGDRGKIDPIEIGSELEKPRVKLCVNCHGKAGLRSLGDFLGRRTYKLSTLRRSDVTKATIAAKKVDERWKALQEYWRAERKR